MQTILNSLLLIIQVEHPGLNHGRVLFHLFFLYTKAGENTRGRVSKNVLSSATTEPRQDTSQCVRFGSECKSFHALTYPSMCPV